MEEFPAAIGPFVGFAAAARATVEQLNRQIPGMDLWLVTCVTEDRQLVVARAGAWSDLAPIGRAFPWQASFCVRMVSGQAPAVAPSCGDEPTYRGVAVGPLAKVRAYLGVPLMLGDGELFGTLCALAGRQQPDSLREAMPAVSLAGRMLSTVLAGERATHERSVEAAQAYALAERDPLTGLQNRRGFTRSVLVEHGRDQRFGTRSSVLVIQLDTHPTELSTDGVDRAALSTDGVAADGVSDGAVSDGGVLDGGVLDPELRCAELVSALCEAGDVAGRLDAGHFALVVPQADALHARAVQARLRHALRGAGLSAAVGVATRRPGEELTQTWDRAEQAARTQPRLSTTISAEPRSSA